MSVDVIIPAYKPGEKFKRLIAMLEKQTVTVNRIIVVNTEEKFFSRMTYGTNFMKQHKTLEVYHISKREFDHGKTRNKGVRYSEAEYFICLTDDAVPENERLVEELLKGFETEGVAVSYGRQIAETDSTIVEQYTRNFNYPDKSVIKSKEDIPLLGIKTFFCSNVCAAYKRSVFQKLGGFVGHTIFNEDMIYAAKVVWSDYKIAYQAEARVIHSHKYSHSQQFHRNFDMGVSQAQHPEIFQAVSSESEGIRFVRETIQYLKKNGYANQILHFVINSGFKYIGYQLGKHYKYLPKWLVIKCSMNKQYWN